LNEHPKKTKKGCMPFCHSPKSFVSKMVPLEGTKSQKKNKHAKQPHKDKIIRDSLRERFIKNKRPLNHTHVSLKKEKQP
jgi:hypothetical protein